MARVTRSNPDTMGEIIEIIEISVIGLVVYGLYRLHQTHKSLSEPFSDQGIIGGIHSPNGDTIAGNIGYNLTHIFPDFSGLTGGPNGNNDNGVVSSSSSDVGRW